MAERAGIPVLPHIINAVMIIAVLSTATADLYVTVISLYMSVGANLRVAHYLRWPRRDMLQNFLRRGAV